MPEACWPTGVDVRETTAPANPPQEIDSLSSSEDMAVVPPPRRQPPRGKQATRAELSKKKKKPNPPAPCKRVGISISEPSECRKVISTWSDDDEDGGKMLQERAARMATAAATARASDRPSQEGAGQRPNRGKAPVIVEEGPTKRPDTAETEGVFG